jgi:hypothetical protein
MMSERLRHRAATQQLSSRAGKGWVVVMQPQQALLPAWGKLGVKLLARNDVPGDYMQHLCVQVSNRCHCFHAAAGEAHVGHATSTLHLLAGVLFWHVVRFSMFAEGCVALEIGKQCSYHHGADYTAHKLC